MTCLYFSGEGLGHLAMLHFVDRVIIVDPLFRVFLQYHADIVTAIREDDAGLAESDDAPADFGRHLIVQLDVCAVVAQDYLRAGTVLRQWTTCADFL